MYRNRVALPVFLFLSLIWMSSGNHLPAKEVSTDLRFNTTFEFDNGESVEVSVFRSNNRVYVDLLPSPEGSPLAVDDFTIEQAGGEFVPGEDFYFTDSGGEDVSVVQNSDSPATLSLQSDAETELNFNNAFDLIYEKAGQEKKLIVPNAVSADGATGAGDEENDDGDDDNGCFILVLSNFL
ncbi:MAG: hypothetical protein ACQERN_02740 [Thermodesulfobacteriota bacterium]